ncbi:MAG: 5-formyltetrahydrofolate cyclo-ligase [Actinobacteria bacterium]|nr:5-formyltetrahydrofolate cyclo-ligase [Actinomycetota bacterium]
MRTRIRAARSAHSPEQRIAAAEALAAHAETLLPHGPAGITCYLSLSVEPGTDQLIAMAQAAGHRVVVPRIDGKRLDWVGLRPDGSLRPGPMGIREPVGDAIDPADLDTFAVLFVPATAVDHHGHRLGQGGGYYDRTLAHVRPHTDGGPLIVAVVFDGEVIDGVPVERHDCRVDAALTPSGIIRFDV